MKSWGAWVAALVVAPFLVWIQYQTFTGHGQSVKPVESPTFTLLDHQGRSVTEADFKGRFLLVYFGYTYCPDVCPTSLSTQAQALDRLGPAADRLEPVMVTIDPQRDTAPIMAEYVRSFSPRIRGLTGTPAQIEQAAKQFGVIYTKHGDGDDYVMDHSAFTVLIGPDGKRLEQFPHGISAETLAERLQRLIGTS